MSDLRVRALSALHRAIYAVSGGRLGRRIAGMPVLLLTTNGRRTGKRRTVPLTFIRDGETIVLVGSYGGRPRDPAWFTNLVAAGEGEVTVGRERRRLCARRATPEERGRLWPVVVATYAGYAAYQAKTSREIPLAILS